VKKLLINIIVVILFLNGGVYLNINKKSDRLILPDYFLQNDKNSGCRPVFFYILFAKVFLAR